MIRKNEYFYRTMITNQKKPKSIIKLTKQQAKME